MPKVHSGAFLALLALPKICLTLLFTVPDSIRAGGQERPSRTRRRRRESRWRPRGPDPPVGSHCSGAPPPTGASGGRCFHFSTGRRSPNRKPGPLRELCVPQRSPSKVGSGGGPSAPGRCVHPPNLLLGGWVSLTEVPQRWAVSAHPAQEGPAHCEPGLHQGEPALPAARVALSDGRWEPRTLRPDLPQAASCSSPSLQNRCPRVES